MKKKVEIILGLGQIGPSYFLIYNNNNVLKMSNLLYYI